MLSVKGITKFDGNPHVITGRKPGNRLTDLQHPWRRIRDKANLPDVRIHDLRHSYASGALALGEGLPMIGKLLGHTQVQTTARYAHLANDPVKLAAGRGVRHHRRSDHGQGGEASGPAKPERAESITCIRGPPALILSSYRQRKR